MPVLAGMVLSVPLTMWTSRASAGRWLRRAGLLLTPEETDPPPELVALNEKMSASVAMTADEPISEMVSEIIVRELPVVVPPRVPLRMEAAPPVYLRPRDALNSLQRMLSASSSAAS
jgi:hypothetical protein